MFKKLFSSREKIVQIVAVIILFMLVVFYAMQYSFDVARDLYLHKRWPTSLLDKGIIRSSSLLDWTSPGKVFDKSFGDYERVPMLDDPDIYRIGKDKVPIDVNYLYGMNEGGDNSAVIYWRNLKTGKVLHKWTFTDSEKKTYPTNVTLLKGKRVLFREAETGKTICLDKDSKVLWVQKIKTHHMYEIGPDETVWTCTYYNDAPNAHDFYMNTAIMQIDTKTGKVLFRKLLWDIFDQNPVHDMNHHNSTNRNHFNLNDVEPIYEDGPYWKKGDLLISANSIHTLFLYRPSTNKIIWRKSSFIGVQHDVDIINDSTIAVFDNNSMFNYKGYDIFDHNEYYVPNHNQFVTYSFPRDTFEVHFQSLFKKHGIRTPLRGIHSWFSNDSIYYAESSDQSFFVIADLKTNKSYKCVIASESNDWLPNLRWFRMMLPGQEESTDTPPYMRDGKPNTAPPNS